MKKTFNCSQVGSGFMPELVVPQHQFRRGARIVQNSLVCGPKGFLSFCAAVFLYIVAKLDGRSRLAEGAKSQIRHESVPAAEVAVCSLLCVVICAPLIRFTTISAAKIHNVAFCIAILAMIACCVTLRLLGIRKDDCCSGYDYKKSYRYHYGYSIAYKIEEGKGYAAGEGVSSVSFLASVFLLPLFVVYLNLVLISLPFVFLIDACFEIYDAIKGRGYYADTQGKSKFVETRKVLCEALFCVFQIVQPVAFLLQPVMLPQTLGRRFEKMYNALDPNRSSCCQTLGEDPNNKYQSSFVNKGFAGGELKPRDKIVASDNTEVKPVVSNCCCKN